MAGTNPPKSGVGAERQGIGPSHSFQSPITDISPALGAQTENQTPFALAVAPRCAEDAVGGGGPR
jgi:hypothetical protein